MKNWFVRTWMDNRAFLLFVVLMSVFRSAVADWNEVPTGSMNPTIVEGDRIFVNKLAYDLRIPFTHHSMYNFSQPNRGDIIVFDSKVSDKRLVKRVIGIPGDIIELRDNALFVNGEKALYLGSPINSLTTDLVENIFGVQHQIRVKKAGSAYSSFPAVQVPSGTLLALGDNRDNSADSRIIGFIPRSEVVGKAEGIVISLNYDNCYLPRKGRYLKGFE